MGRVTRVCGIVLAALPLSFGALRAVTSGTDFRYLVTAGVVVAAGGWVFRRASFVGRPVWMRPAVAVALSFAAGVLAAFGQGAASVGAVATVVGGFAVAVTLGGLLGAFTRPPR